MFLCPVLGQPILSIGDVRWLDVAVPRDACTTSATHQHLQFDELTSSRFQMQLFPLMSKRTTAYTTGGTCRGAQAPANITRLQNSGRGAPSDGSRFACLHTRRDSVSFGIVYNSPFSLYLLEEPQEA